MPLIVDLIDEVISQINDEQVIPKVRKKVNEMMEGYPLFNG
jgi:glycine hydroxymethyltransferase